MSYIQTPNPWEHEPSKSGLVSLNPHHALHLSVSGRPRHPGQPLVIIIPGFSSSAIEWAAVNRLVARFARVLLYDRSGYGLSSETDTNPITAVSIATELDNLLHAAGIAGPFVLVCHSWGGIIGREFLHLRGQEDISGIVFVDANQELNTIEGWWPAPYIDAVCQGLDVLDVTGITKNHQLRPDEWQAYLVEEKSDRHARTATAEAAGYRGSGSTLASKNQLHASPPLLGDRPVSVLKGHAHCDLENILAAGIKAGTGTEKDRELMREMLKTYDTKDEKWQRGILSLSSRSKWTVASKSGHNVQFTEPEVIAGEVQWVLDQIGLS